MNKITNIKYLFLYLILSFLIGCGSSQKVVEKGLRQADTIYILAVNDIHATIDNFPRFGYMADSLRKLHPHLLLVSGGDNQTGNPINDQYAQKGMPVIALMKALQFDLSSVGNHEFDTQPDGFAHILKEAGFDFVSANIHPDDAEKHPLKPYKIITTPRGTRLVFTSVIDLNANGIPDTHPDNVKGFSFSDPLEVAQRNIALADSSDILIYVNHYGFENDVDLANQLPPNKVDVIIGGHSHTKVDTEQLHNGILITQAERKLKYATLIELIKNAEGDVSKSMKLLTVGRNGNENEKLRAMVDKFNDNPKMQEKIAEMQDDFQSFEQIGYLMADALRSSANTDIALLNPGGVRINHLKKGAITVLDVYSMDPFGNEMVVFNLKGQEIKALLQNAYKFDEYMPIFPSGINTKYYLDENGEVKDVQIYLSPTESLDMDKTYTVSMNNYMATVYEYDHDDPGTGLFRPTAESMIDYLKELKEVPSYKNEKRVEIIAL